MLPLQTINSTPTDVSMGDWVTFHHRAAVARYKKLHKELPNVGWKLVQGVNSSDVLYPGDPDTPWFNNMNWNHLRYAFAEWPQAKGHFSTFNKTVMVWPEQGTGMIIGKIRRSIGESSSGYISDYEYPEYEQGYHNSDMMVDLYVVKKYMNGTDYIFCPVWSVSLITSKESEEGRISRG